MQITAFHKRANSSPVENKRRGKSSYIAHAKSISVANNYLVFFLQQVDRTVDWIAREIHLLCLTLILESLYFVMEVVFRVLWPYFYLNLC